MHRSVRYFIMLCLLIASWQFSYSQSMTQNKQQAVEYYELAKDMITSTRAMDDARDLMVIAANTDTTNLKANFDAGYMHITTINKEEAVKYFMRVYRQMPDYRFDLEYWIGRSYQYDSKFDKAIEFYNRYKDRLNKTSTSYAGLEKISAKEVDRKIEESNNGKELIANPKSFSIINLGSEVNSDYDDYAPVVSADENQMIFTTRRREGNTYENVWDDNKPYEDIFITEKVNGKWTQAKNIGAPINSKYNNSNLTLSPDGNTLFVYKDGVGDGDIFFTERQPDGTWNTPQPLPGTINSPYHESSVTITKDGNTIYFASERPGGLGKSDIYSATKNSKGVWSVIKNLGPSINTEYDEEAPYIDYDGKTLYFSSMGRKGMGGRDIFKATLIDETKSEWSEPENLGHPINTPDDDIFITGTSTPNRFYFASERAGGYGYSDIYLITDKQDEKQDKVVVETPKVSLHKLELLVLDAETEDLLKATVRMKGMDNSAVAGRNSSDGYYEFMVMSPVPKDYLVYVEMDGYLFENITFTLGGVFDKEMVEQRKILMKKINVGAVSVLRHVFFDIDKAILKPESFDELDKLIKLLQQNVKVRIEIGGHTDNTGTHEYNMSLSNRRAEAVRAYLISKGLDAKRVTSVGYGETQPIVSNDDEESGREINRRVEFKVIQN
jgi:tetratricopeptide (TPR) repeat protein